MSANSVVNNTTYNWC